MSEPVTDSAEKVNYYDSTTGDEGMLYIVGGQGGGPLHSWYQGALFPPISID